MIVLAEFILETEMFQTNVQENQTHINVMLYRFFLKILPVMW
jgi:hypothetical protein